MGTWQPLQPFHKAYPTRGKAAALTAPSGKQLRVHQVKVSNRSGGTTDAGLVVKLSLADVLGFGQLDDSATPDFIDAAATILAGTAVDIFSTTANDGVLIQSAKPFNLIGLTISQAETGSPVYEYSYYNGTAYATFTPISAPAAFTAADHFIAFAQPLDWAVGTTAAVGGSTAKYSIRIRATTAPSQAVKATAVWLGQFLEFADTLADNAVLSVSYDEQIPLVLESQEGLMPYFGTANAGNLISGYYQVSG